VESGILRAAKRLKPRSAVILTYHSVRPDLEFHADWIGPGITHTTAVFDRQMALLARKFTPVSLDDVLLFVKGEKELTGWPVAVTFDDGFLDNLLVASPVLDRYGIRAAFYLTVGLIGSSESPWYSRIRHAILKSQRHSWQSSMQQRTFDLSSAAAREGALLAAYDSCAHLVKGAQSEAINTIERELGVERVLPPSRLMMNWDEALALQRAGHIVGSHTMTHPNVAHVKQESDLRDELAESKRVIEERLDIAVSHFSYPHPALTPQWNERTVEATRDAGYATAVTTSKGPVRQGSNPLALKRINAPRAEHEFLWNLERAFLKA
jgi:peptidoglycan/xylan/chitin deacetylase (PgdA/CDA1 family)